MRRRRNWCTTTSTASGASRPSWHWQPVEGVVVNADGSYDIWFGPTAPAGHESNWVQTAPGKGWNVILRLYGPGQSWFDKSWRPGEIDLQQ